MVVVTQYREDLCPVCNSKGGHFCSCRSIASNPQLMREWHPQNSRPPQNVSIHHGRDVLWQCQKCNHEWLARPWSRSINGSSCPQCSRHRRRHGPITTERPDLIKEWDASKNSLDPEKLTCGSARRVWWKCQNCQHSWETPVAQRALYKTTCRKCGKRLLAVTRTAQTSP